METNKRGKDGGSAFLWGLIIGALLATLITTKRGRLILREITGLGIELIENFVEERTKDNNNSPIEEIPTEPAEHNEKAKTAETPKSKDEVSDETPAEFKKHTETTVVHEFSFDDNIDEAPAPADPRQVKSNGQSHPKKRLFRGLRRHK